MCFSSRFDSRRSCKKSLGGDAMQRHNFNKMFLDLLAYCCRTAFSGENRSKAFEMVVTVWTSF